MQSHTTAMGTATWETAAAPLRTTITAAFGSNYRLLIVAFASYFSFSSSCSFFSCTVSTSHCTICNDKCLCDVRCRYLCICICCGPYFIAAFTLYTFSLPANKLFEKALGIFCIIIIIIIITIIIFLWCLRKGYTTYCHESKRCSTMLWLWSHSVIIDLFPTRIHLGWVKAAVLLHKPAFQW